MDFFKTPYQLGNLTLASNIFFSPLAGCSDLPYRQMLAHYFTPGLVFCEMVKMDALVRYDPHTFRLLDYLPSMHPIGGQLCGSKLEYAAKSARILEELGFDVIDFNCGCPVDKVTRDGSGSGMLKQPELIGEILAAITAAVKIPVTVKIRAGWDEHLINGPEIVKIAEKAGAKIIFVHGRTREQAYRGPAVWDYIRRCKEAAQSIQVFGNGDLVSGMSPRAMWLQTGCDGFLLSRGAMGKPWLLKEIYETLVLGNQREAAPKDFYEALSCHLEKILDYETVSKAGGDFRRVICYYLNQMSGTKPIKEKLQGCKGVNEMLALLKSL